MIKWELIGKATEFVAEEMGVALKRSAISPNIRERMDHSCAVLDPEGRIVAQAEHIPVHLGSFKICSTNILDWLTGRGMILEEGDMLILNDPYISGTHLNDVTIIAPVYVQSNLEAYVINKAHIVDVGGPVPGSLNPNAATLYEEGFVISPTRIVKAGRVDAEIMSLIKENFKDSLTAEGDINAQMAANRMGISRVKALFERFGSSNVREAWRESNEHSSELSSSEIRKWPRGTFEATDFMELSGEHIPLHVAVSIKEGSVHADFTGSHEQVTGPLNAVPGVTYSAVAFVVRCLLESDIQTNDGFYRNIESYAPYGTMVNPEKPYAVSGGNVETTQRLADLVLLAMSNAMKGRIPAASSGTMMNVMIGGRRNNAGWAYYETIGGGTGGRPNSNGVSGVHSNMTNTLNTPVEIAEMEYPLVFTANSLVPHSGGKGRYHGGDGIVRSFRVLEPCTLSIISERVEIPPWGLEGGMDGRKGRITIVRNGTSTEMPSKFTTNLQPGDEVILETPGGGGYGKPERE